MHSSQGPIMQILTPLEDISRGAQVGFRIHEHPSKIADTQKAATTSIPAGTSPGKILRLQGKGLPEFNGFGFGDILIKTHLRIPNPLNEEQLEALKHFD
jgi:DnaJ-class molecular chaperone